MRLYLFGLLFVLNQSLFGQDHLEENFFQIEFDAFSPPQQEMIHSFEGKEPMAFMANDISGKSQYLKDYKGKVVFVYFFNGECETCKNQVGSLNLLQKELADKLQIISFADEGKEQAISLAKESGIEYPVLTNGKLIGEAAYGIELGYPRLFAIDKKGVVQHVFPQMVLEGKTDIYLQLKKVFDELWKE